MAMKTYNDSQIKKLKDQTDWTRVKNMHDSDIDFSDSIKATPAMLAGAVRHSRGRPIKENKKMLINLRLDPEIITFFQSMGAGWQTRINDSLLQVVKLRSLL